VSELENAIDEKKNNVEEEESNGNLDEKQLEGDDGVEEKALEVNTVSFIQELHQWCNG
jgi:hypothetical protein